MNYAYTLGILEARIEHRADRLQRLITQVEDQLPDDACGALYDEIINLRADIEYAKTRGEYYD